jgi:hypothetical protein
LKLAAAIRAELSAETGWMSGRKEYDAARKQRNSMFLFSAASATGRPTLLATSVKNL